MPIRGLCPPLLRPPEPRQDDRSFSVVDPGTYVGLLPWEFTATLTEEVDSSAIISAEPTRISADPTRASYIAYPLPKCPTETWFTLDDSEGCLYLRGPQLFLPVERAVRRAWLADFNAGAVVG